MHNALVNGTLRFSVFEVDLHSGELRKRGVRVPLQQQPFRVLVRLVEHPGEIVTREELRQELWPADTYVDFEQGINAAVKRLREALGDSAEAPRFIETLAKRGYRFIAPLNSPNPLTPETAHARTQEHEGVQSAGVPPAFNNIPRANAKPRWTAILTWGLALGVVATLIASGLISGSGRLFTRASVGHVPLLSRLTFDAGLQTEPSFSPPDGRFIAFASNKPGNFDIFVQPVAGGEAIQVTRHSAHDWQPDWSPDGSRIVFRSERDRGGLFVVSAFGGKEEKITSFGYRPRWSPDGSRILFSTTALPDMVGRVYIASSTGQAPIEISGFLPGGVTNDAVSWHPGGRQVSFLGQGGDGARLRLTTIDLDGNRAVVSEVLQPVSNSFDELGLVPVLLEPFAWNSAGTAIYFSGVANDVTDVWKLGVDPATLAITSGPVRLTASQERDLSVTISRDGSRLAYSASTANTVLSMYSLDTGQHVISQSSQPLTSPEMNAGVPRVSQDGARLLFYIERPGASPASRELRARWLDGGREELIRRGDSRHRASWSPAIESPDGRQVAFLDSSIGSDGRSYPTSIKLLNLNTREESQLTSPVGSSGSSADRHEPCGWSPDGRFVVSSVTRDPPRPPSITLLPVTAAPRAETQELVIADSSSPNVLLRCFAVSIEGWVLFGAMERGQARTTATLYVVNVTGGSWLQVTDGSLVGGAAWSSDARTIYFSSSRGGVFNAWRIDFDPKGGKTIGPEYQLTHFDGAAATIAPSAEIAVARGRLIVPLARPTGSIWMLDRLTQ
jgi:Tol biopolymer transport system component/DNA-binding winged helix-turn-helix (wHTH) protein